MIRPDIFQALPIIIIAIFSVLGILFIAVKRSHAPMALLTFAGFYLAFFLLFLVQIYNQVIIPISYNGLLIIDSFSFTFMKIILIASLFVTLLSYHQLQNLEDRKEEFYILLLLSTLGAMILCCSCHFASFFLGLELLTVPAYAMISYVRQRSKSLEAGVKYIILAGASSAFLLFGMSLIYSEVGTMGFQDIMLKLSQPDVISNMSSQAIIGLGLVLMTVAIGFKLSAVPFHMWAPDIYEGSPASVSAFLSTVSKVATLAILFRFFFSVEVLRGPILLKIYSIIALASMFIGNILALLQKNIKRLLAYSSMAHVGYILVAFVSGGELGTQAAMFYATAYVVTILIAFSVVTFLSKNAHEEKEDLHEYAGLFWTRPWVASIFGLSLLSLIGMPLTGGFIGKTYIINSGIHSGNWSLILCLAINSALGLYYYLKVFMTLFVKADHGSEPSTHEVTGQTELPLTILGSIVLTLLALALLWMGVFPDSLLKTINSI